MICFQADADLNQIIVKACRRAEPNMDFQTAAEGGLIGISDSEVLSVAARLERVLVTHDRKTMPMHFADRIVDKSSAGGVVVPQSMAVRAVVGDLVLIWMASEAEEWVNRIRALPL
ncbi:DUF5615 family PIN-like protein [cf. Phormidesmis sp. LEGE 11477]|uniref:DUF5615 family PIN-like protein n=1 Tax=cf. Phormidesmis sp. LEGE 11477 TaxID=1828680 RepID=UPI0018823944|nr:DUF5615 family PIN-like protein [cf. Phormidesmis sp. LEGE 11477]MBE9064019.1 DUF5615 family PIN-like protein [cf. Phormidesmis sp. LEGE 11477]